jgi:hypothetical protein
MCFIPTHVLTLLSVTDIVCFVTEIGPRFRRTVIVTATAILRRVTPEAPRRGALLGWVWTPEREAESKDSIELLKLIKHLQDVGTCS